MRIYLIDGTNVLYKNKNTAKYVSKDYASACNSLIYMLKAYSTRFPSFKFLLFFDGYNESVPISYRNIQIEWSFSRTADELIRDFVRHNYEQHEYVLVSSDLEVHNFGRIHSLEAITSEQFLATITPEKISAPSIYKADSQQYHEKPSSASRKEVSRMLQLFKDAGEL